MGDRPRKRKFQESLVPDGKLVKDNVSAWRFSDCFLLLEEAKLELLHNYVLAQKTVLPLTFSFYTVVQGSN